MSLPGVGPSLAARIEQAYGGAAEFAAACQTLDLDRLLQIEGLSERRAFDLVATVRNRASPELVRTERGRDVRRELEDLLASYAQTEYGRRRLRMLPVLRDESEILQSQERIATERQRLEGLDRAAIGRCLARITRPKDPRPVSTGRVLVVDGDDEEYHFRAAGLDRWVRIVHANEVRSLDADGVILDCTSEGWEGDQCVRLGPKASLAKAVPESELLYVQSNRATLEALVELSRLTGATTVAEEILGAVPETAESSPIDVKKAAQQALVQAQSFFEQQVGGLNLSGAQILEFLSKGLTRSLEAARAASVSMGRQLFKELTGLSADPFEPGLPLRLDDEELDRLSRDHIARSRVRAFEEAQEAAATIQKLRPRVADEVARWLEYDVHFALACYALDFEANPAKTSNRLWFRRAAHARFRLKGGFQAIDYEIGGDASLAVLTGANSGGKTSLLELVAQLVILHHWGLPVPAQQAEIPLVSEVVFLGATRGADAGAFETFLRELFPPLTRPGRKLLLLDEVESVTELEAAGKILGVFIDEAARSECLGVLVTHLPNEVLAHARTRVRIDGIDAVGLDEKFNLIVDRQPKLNHRARSTPELILRRVHSKSQGPVKDLYAKVLGRWG